MFDAFTRCVAVEINPGMLIGLRREAAAAKNVVIIEEDITSYLATAKLNDASCLLLAQNTLGTIEGAWKAVIMAIGGQLKEHNGHLVLSLFCSRALPTWGRRFYAAAAEMVGEEEHMDLENGIFMSRSGYVSEWFNQDELRYIERTIDRRALFQRSADEWVVNVY